MNYQVKKISWIKTIIAPINDSNSVTVEVLVHAGSNYETIENNGISHFLEHMFFKGGKKYTMPKQVAEVVDAFGWEFNAFTSGLYAGYYVKCAPNFVDKAIEVLGDMLVDAQFPNAEIEREKKVVIQEVMMKLDDPSSLVYDKWKHYFFGDNSFGRSTLWPIENIKKFSQDDLFEYKNSFYTKDNLLLIVAWKIDNQVLLEEMLDSAFSNLPEKKKWNLLSFDNYTPNKKSDFFGKWTEQNHLIISATWFSWSNKKKYAAGLLATILWGNMSSRLFQNIREKQWLCYYIGGSHYSMPHTGIFLVKVWLEKWRFEFAMEKIYQEIDNVAKWNFTEEELQKALWYRTGQIQMWIESSDEMASFLGEQYLLYDKIDSLEDILSFYKKQTLDDLKDVAKSLMWNNLFSYWIE